MSNWVLSFSAPRPENIWLVGCVNSFSRPMEHVISSICTNELRICFAMWLQLVTKHENLPARKGNWWETQEGLWSGQCTGHLWFSSLPFCYVPHSAYILICVLYFPQGTSSSADVGTILQGMLCFQCFMFCFHTALIYVTFPDPWRLAQVLLTLPACLSRRQKQTLAVTPGQLVKLLLFGWGIWFCVYVTEPVTIHRPRGLLELLHSPATSCTGRQSLLWGQLPHWTVALLCSFLLPA